MQRVAARLLTLASVLILLAIALFLAFAHPRYQVGLLVKDDAGYYMAIARNYGMGYGYSFDRIEATNGFNPLLPGLLIVLNRIFSQDLDLIACFRIATLTTWVFLVLGLVALRGLARRVLDNFDFPNAWREVAVAAVSLWYAGFIGLKGYYGVDAFLVLGLGLLWLARVSKYGLLSRGPTNGLLDGALLGGVVLARVDSMPLAMVAFAVMLTRALKDRRKLGPLAVRVLVFVAVVMPYLFWNKIQFGDWLPISARLKTAFPHINLPASLGAVLNTSINKVDIVVLFATFAMAALWCLILVLSRFKPHPSSRQEIHHDPLAEYVHDAMAIAALYLLARLIWVIAFSRFDVQSSYFILAGPFLVIAILALWGRWQPARGAMLACLALIGITGVLIIGRIAIAVPQVRAIAGGKADNGWEVAQRIHDGVSETDVIFGGAQGLVGYLADRKWINGDGVANNRAYQDAINDGQLAAYLTCRGVTVIEIEGPLGELPSGTFSRKETSHLYGTSDEIELHGGDAKLIGDQLARDQRLWLVPWVNPNAGMSTGSCESLPGSQSWGNPR